MRWLAAMVALIVGASAHAAPERRIALLVGHPFGGAELTPLRYVANDLDCELVSCHGLTGLDPMVCSGVGTCTNWDQGDCPAGLLGDECELVEVCN